MNKLTRIIGATIDIMRAKQLERKSSSWSISGTVPNMEQAFSHYGANFNVGVTAKTMEEALAAVRKSFPDATFISVHHRGDVHIIVSDQ